VVKKTQLLSEVTKKLRALAPLWQKIITLCLSAFVAKKQQ